MARARLDADETIEAAKETARTAASNVAEGAQEMRDQAVQAAKGAGEMAKSLAEGAGEIGAQVSEKLKTVGVDTDAMLSAAKSQAGELQKLLADELRARPLRALGLAAAAGLILGYLSAR